MMLGAWGKKIGMTQIFIEDKVVPVTVVDVGNWVITNIKKEEKGGYNAVQIGCLKKRYSNKPFSAEWLKNLNTYFSFIKEIRLQELIKDLAIGQKINFTSVLPAGQKIDIFGYAKGCGFAGVVKRHDFNGPPGSHGSTMGNQTGSLSFMRSQGRVIKGKRMPGHFGTDRQIVRNVEIVKMLENPEVVLIKGSVPGKAGSLLYIRKQLN